MDSEFRIRARTFACRVLERFIQFDACPVSFSELVLLSSEVTLSDESIDRLHEENGLSGDQKAHPSSNEPLFIFFFYSIEVYLELSLFFLFTFISGTWNAEFFLLRWSIEHSGIVY